MENSLTKQCPDELAEKTPDRVVLDELDQLPFLAMPERILGNAEKIALDAINSMVATGPHSPAMYRLMCGEIQLARAGLRFAEAIFHVEATKFFRKNENIRRLDAASRLVVLQHRRLLADVETYSRVAGGVPTRLHVTAHQAMVNVGSST